jgi:hypothetical protein
MVGTDRGRTPSGSILVRTYILARDVRGITDQDTGGGKLDIDPLIPKADEVLGLLIQRTLHARRLKPR